MLFALRLVVLTLCFNLFYCERRMTGHHFATADKRFVVYLIQSKQSTPQYHAWLCGGALVKTNKILTAAGCLLQSSNLYAIAGYRRYINTRDLDDDNCTKQTKRRVIKTCIPHGYQFNPLNATAWVTLDIGVAVVDQPYSSKEYLLFKLHCDYNPKPIRISYYKEVVFENLDVLAYGWGFRRGRHTYDKMSDYNSEMLKFAPTSIAKSSICKAKYTDKGMSEVIDKYMLCVHKRGVLDDDGLIVDLTPHERINCRGDAAALRLKGEDCDANDLARSGQMDDARRQMVFNTTGTSNETNNNQELTNNTRRQIIRNDTVDTNFPGICQNDHGGPLVAYIGVQEMLIGIAATTLYDDSYQCVGPSLFTGTGCASGVVMCMLADNPMLRRTYEQVIRADGIEIIERNVEWADDPSYVTPAPSGDPGSGTYSNESTGELANKTTL